MDSKLEKLLPPALRIEKIKAFRVTKPRLIGDIGIRAFFQLYKKAKQIIKSETINFVYIPIPSFYCALLGRWLHSSTGIRYGIDYIDPWVHEFPGSSKKFSRPWISTKIARFLEPVAIKKASLITGVSQGYYQPVLERNPHLKASAISGAMPYGGEATDHHQLEQLYIDPYLFTKKKDTMQLVYAGTMLPKAYQPLEAIFKAINANKAIFANIEFHFIGTGSRANDANSYTIRPLAERYGLYNSTIFEYPRRIPYLDVLIHLAAADGIFILGSTEPHYTPSKIYQGILAGKPILAVLHKDSTAVAIVQKSGSGMVLSFNGIEGLPFIETRFQNVFKEFIVFKNQFNPAQINVKIFESYSAKSVTEKLVKLLNEANAIISG